MVSKVICLVFYITCTTCTMVMNAHIQWFQRLYNSLVSRETMYYGSEFMYTTMAKIIIWFSIKETYVLRF